MNSEARISPRSQESDYARLEIETPFPVGWLEKFFADPMRLLRLNPLITFKDIERQAPDRWRLSGHNEANGRAFEIVGHLISDEHGWHIQWNGWLKNETRLEISGGEQGRLIITDDYSATPLDERRRRMDEVDTSFTAWGQAVHRYLRYLKRFAWLPGWRWFMAGPWINMKPSARRISILLFWLTVAEFMLFLMVFTVFWVEYRV